MAARNDVTNDLIKSKGNSQAYRDNWDRIFSKKEETKKDNTRVEFETEWFGMYDSIEVCKSCGFKYMLSADACTEENRKRSEHVCK